MSSRKIHDSTPANKARFYRRYSSKTSNGSEIIESLNDATILDNSTTLYALDMYFLQRDERRCSTHTKNIKKTSESTTASIPQLQERLSMLQERLSKLQSRFRRIQTQIIDKKNCLELQCTKRIERQITLRSTE